jgi:hypothetical protein
MCAGNPVVLFIDAALLTNRLAELAIDDDLTTGIVIAAVGAGERMVDLVDAAFQPHGLADWVAHAIEAADFASAAFGVCAAGIFSIRNAVDTATSPAGSTALWSTRCPAFVADKLYSRIGRGTLVNRFTAGVSRRIGRRIGWWNVFDRGSLVYDRIDRRIGSRLRNFFILSICPLAAEGGGTHKSTEKSFEHKATRCPRRQRAR